MCAKIDFDAHYIKALSNIDVESGWESVHGLIGALGVGLPTGDDIDGCIDGEYIDDK